MRTIKGPSNRKNGPTAFQRVVLGMFLASSTGLMGTACAPASRLEVLIHDSPRGRVYVETVPDASFEATHPISVDPTVVTLILRGVMVQPQERLLQTLVAGRAAAARVFSDEDTAFLTPYLVQALATAGPRQRVQFHVSNTASAASPEVAGGTLYVQGRLLHLSLTHYRDSSGNREQDSKPGRLLPDPTGLENYLVSFTPELARVREEDLVATFKEPASTTVVIDSRLLAQTVVPERTVLPGRTDAEAGKGAAPSAAEELRSMKDLAKEIQALKQEVESLRGQLADRDARARKPPSRAPSGTHNLAPAP